MTRTSAPPHPKRSLRCPRCADRKFRVTGDLALHILSKHGHATLPATPDDARSVTQTSPAVAELAELDSLLRTANAVTRPDDSCAPQVRPSRRKQRAPSAGGRRKRSWTSCSSSDTAEEDPKRIRDADYRGDKVVQSNEGAEEAPAEGESTGPRAKDTYAGRCLAGKVPLVPIPLQPTAMLNFANGLF